MSKRVLFGFGRGYGLPDISPFVVKTMVLLKMANLPFEINTHGFKRAPKGKLPYLLDDAAIIADSSFIYWHLEQKYALTLNAWLSPAELATAWAFEKLLEDHLYWAVLYERWAKEEHFRQGPYQYFKFLPWPLRAIVPGMVRKKIVNSLRAQGMGRHSEAEIVQLAKKDLAAISAFLGDKPYLMGEQACSSDATVFAFCQSALCPQFDGELQAYAASHENIKGYVARMKQQFDL